MTQARTQTVFDRVAARILALEDGAYGDERERGILMEANAFGLTVGIAAALALGLALAVIGQLLAPFLLVLLAIVPATAANLYARRRDVDAMELAERAGARSTQIATLAVGLAVVLIFAAMSFTVFVGDPLISALADRPSEGLLGGMVQGGVIGGVLGGSATVVGAAVSMARSRRGV